MSPHAASTSALASLPAAVLASRVTVAGASPPSVTRGWPGCSAPVGFPHATVALATPAKLARSFALRFESATSSESLEIRDHVGDILPREGTGGPVLRRRARAEAVGQGGGAAVVHERRTPSNAHERRNLERTPRSDVHREVVGELRLRMARRASHVRALEEG